MELQKICDKIISDAQLEADKISSQAKEHAAEIITKQDLQNQDIAVELQNKAKNSGKDIYDRIISAAHLNESKRMLAKKRELLDVTFQKALTELHNMSEEDFRAFVKKVSENISENAIFVFAAEFKDKITNEFLKSVNPLFSLSDKTVESGFAVHLEKSYLNFDFSDILERLSREKDTEIANILFDEAGV